MGWSCCCWNLIPFPKRQDKHTRAEKKEHQREKMQLLLTLICNLIPGETPEPSSYPPIRNECRQMLLPSCQTVNEHSCALAEPPDISRQSCGLLFNPAATEAQQLLNAHVHGLSVCQPLLQPRFYPAPSLIPIMLQPCSCLGTSLILLFLTSGNLLLISAPGSESALTLGSGIWTLTLVLTFISDPVLWIFLTLGSGIQTLTTGPDSCSDCLFLVSLKPPLEDLAICTSIGLFRTLLFTAFLATGFEQCCKIQSWLGKPDCHCPHTLCVLFLPQPISSLSYPFSFSFCLITKSHIPSGVRELARDIGGDDVIWFLSLAPSSQEIS